MITRSDRESGDLAEGGDDLEIRLCSSCPFRLVDRARGYVQRCGRSPGKPTLQDRQGSTTGLGYPTPPLWCPIPEEGITITIRRSR